MERWEDEQLQTLEVALGLSPGTITAADIAYLIQRSCSNKYYYDLDSEYGDDYYDEDDDFDLCLSMQQHCQVSFFLVTNTCPICSRRRRHYIAKVVGCVLCPLLGVIINHGIRSRKRKP